MTTYHFTLSKNKTRKRQKAINLLVCFDRTTRRIIPTKIHVLENQWDKADERVIRHSGRRYSTPSWRISGKRCRRTSPDNLPDAHRRQDGERVHGDEPWWHTESGYSYGLCPSGRARQQEGLGRDPLVSKKCKDLCKFYHRYSVINSCMHSKTRFQPRFVIDLFSIYEKSVHLPRVIKKDSKEGL